MSPPISTGAPRSARQAWLSAALICATLLIVPLLAWLIAPRPGGFIRPPALPQSTRVEAAAVPEAPAHLARPDTVREPPRPDAPASDTAVLGVVLNPDGRPVPKALVGCADRDKELTTTTDPEGKFKLGPEAAGCMAASRHVKFSPSERVKLVAGRENVIRLNRGGAIDGEVVDERARPISPYLLAIESFVGSGEASESIPPSNQARSIQDAKGAFLFDDLQPGKYVLTASAEGRPPARTASIEVEAGRTTHHVHIVLAKGATLTGKVIDAETHKPIVDAVVALDAMTSTNANMVLPAHSDDKGVYQLEGAPPGPFSIRVAHERYRTKIVPGITARSATVNQDVDLQPRGDGGAGNTELAGVGAVLIPQAQGVAVSWVLQNGPADNAGLHVGDVLVRIDGLDAQGLTMTDCVQRLRGPEGSRVLVSVRREYQQVDLMITRQVLVRP